MYDWLVFFNLTPVEIDIRKNNIKKNRKSLQADASLQAFK